MPGRNDEHPAPPVSPDLAGIERLDGDSSRIDVGETGQSPVSRLADRAEAAPVRQPAPLLRLNTRLACADREYLVQSTVDPANKRMRCDIFGEGIRLSTVDGEETAELPTERVFPTLKRLHDHVVGELDRLFKISRSAADAREPALLNYIGELYASREMWLEARREFDRAALLSPDYDRALYNLAMCYMHLSLYSEAADTLERAVRLKPSFPDYLNRLGEAYLELSSCRKAVDHFRRAAQTNPYYWEPYFNLGLAHIMNGIRREDYRMHVDLKRKAVDMFEKAAVIFPALRSNRYFLGQRYLEEDRLTESYAAYAEAKRRALDRPQPIPISPLDLALCSDRFMPTESELSAEIARLREEARIHPHYADLRFRLAQSYTMLAQLVHRRAINEYDRALDINPEFTAARRNKKLAENEDKGMSVLVKATLRSGRLDPSPAPVRHEAPETDQPR